MTDFGAYSSESLAERRRKLRRRRSWKVLLTVWRTLLVTGMASGLLWSLTLRFWILNSPEQVEVQGTELLDPDTIVNLLPLTYPLSLLQVQPQNLVDILEASAPIANAAVIREVSPPRLIIRVQERRPVAQATLLDPSTEASPPNNVAGGDVWGVLDELGFWISLEQFQELKSSEALPTLKVLGMRPTLRDSWASMYQILLKSPVQVQEVDWRNPSNVILKTELGVVHVGPYGEQFATQLKTLDQLRDIAEYADPKTIAHIDLHNPQTPYLQTVSSPNPKPTPSPSQP